MNRGTVLFRRTESVVPSVDKQGDLSFPLLETKRIAKPLALVLNYVSPHQTNSLIVSSMNRQSNLNSSYPSETGIRLVLC